MIDCDGLWGYKIVQKTDDSEYLAEKYTLNGVKKARVVRIAADDTLELLSRFHAMRQVTQGYVKLTQDGARYEIIELTPLENDQTVTGIDALFPSRRR